MTMQVDIAQLRKVSAVKGLVNNEVHAQLISAGWTPSCQPLLHIHDRGTRGAHVALWRHVNGSLCMVQLRRRVWPVLLGIDGTEIPHSDYLQWAGGTHRDSSVIEVDVQRSLWSYTAGDTFFLHASKACVMSFRRRFISTSSNLYWRPESAP